MTSFEIPDSALEGIKDQVVIVTGASSGIGLATVKRLFKHGAKVYASDLNDLPEPEKSQIPFLKVDVASWTQQLALFKAAKEKYGAIHHVFANAGMGPTVSLLEDDVDENGDLLPPRLDTINVNLISVMYSVKLAVNYIKQNPQGGSIVMTGSGSSFTRFSPTDYTTAKHGVYGLLRSMYENLSPKLPIRINSIAPSWTATGLVPKELISAIGEEAVQSPDVVARSVIDLMASEDKHGQMIYSERGKFWDIENGENGFVAHTQRMLGGRDVDPEQDALRKLRELMDEKNLSTVEVQGQEKPAVGV